MTMLRYAVAVAMLVHGFAHLPGVVTAWRLQVLPDFPYHTVLLRGRLDVGDAGMRIMGALWLAAAVGFGIASAAAFMGDAHWLPLACAAALMSSAICALEWPLARVGFWVDIALLAVLVLAARFSAT